MSVKITALEAENVKRIKAVALTPSPTGLTLVGGNNNQGWTPWRGPWAGTVSVRTPHSGTVLSLLLTSRSHCPTAWWWSARAKMPA